MAKILTFRTKDDETIASEDFLQDGSQTLSFDDSQDGGTSVGVLSLDDAVRSHLFPKRDLDWSNQELADLFRVKRLLDTAGVPNEVERGLTDEGDPWFIFCRHDGEVFIHLCRIDGLYLLDSPNLVKPLQGANFDALIGDFTNRALPGQDSASGDTERRVIRLERGGKVFLHPSVLLAALVWTLFIASDELVLLAPKDGEEDDGLDLLAAFDFSTLTGGMASSELIETETGDDLETAATAKQDSAVEQYLAMEADPQQREYNGLTMQQGVYAMGLSSIAIALGLMSESSFADKRDAFLGAIAAIQDGSASPEQLANSDETDNTDTTTPIFALLNEISAFLNGATAQGEDTQTALLEQDATSDPDAIAAIAAAEAFAATLVADVSTEAVASDVTDAAGLDDETALPEEVVLAEAPTPPEENVDSTADLVLPETVTLSALKESWTSNLHDISFDGTLIQASADITQGDLIELGLIGSTDSGSSSLSMPDDTVHLAAASGLPVFDQAAQSYIDSIIAQSGDFDMIALQDELIFLDLDAVGSGDAYAISWQLEDGGVISLIGMRSELQDFDLIA